MALSSRRFDYGLFTRAHPDEDRGICGDAGLIKQIGNRLFAVIIDGLGHGIEAHEIAVIAKRHFDAADPARPADRIMDDLHNAIRGSRGLVATVCVIDGDAGHMDYCGVGNITTRILGPSPKTLVSGNGIVGYIMSTPKIERLSLPPGATVILHSDGIPAQTRSATLTAMLESDAQKTAERIVDELGRVDDDAGCIVIRLT